MDGGEKVRAVKTTSALQWRKHKPTHDRFLGLYKWTAPQLPSFSLQASHFCYPPSSSTLRLPCPSCFSSKCLLPLSLNHFPNVMPLSLCLRVSPPHSLPVNWAEITAILSIHGVPGHIIRTNLIRLSHDSHYHGFNGFNAQIQANPLQKQVTKMVMWRQTPKTVSEEIILLYSVVTIFLHALSTSTFNSSCS